MEIDERMNRILAITDFYLSRFGRTQVGIFQLPTSDPNPSWFYIFINTLMSALRRNNYMPYNFWIRDIPGERFILILWVNGYFRTNLQEITPFVERAWGVHSPGSVSVIGSFPFSMESTAEDKNSFRQTVASLIQPSGTVIAPARHQRTFGGSQIR